MVTNSVRNAAWAGLPLVLVAALGCSSSSPGETTSATGTSTANSAAASGSGGAASSTASTTSSTATSGGGGSGGGVAEEYAALIRGTLVDAADLAKAKATHDMIAAGGEASSKAAGDIAHDVLLGTTLLDSTENEFLAIDRWTDSSAMQAFYANPMVVQAFGSLFSTPPTIEFFVREPTWVTWGTMDSGDASDPYFFHLALGTLKETDIAKNQMAHDQVAAGGKAPSIGAGNVAHIVFLGLADKRRFVGVDIWSKADNIQAFYTNPMFVAAFAPLFESVTQPVYHSTDWHQW